MRGVIRIRLLAAAALAAAGAACDLDVLSAEYGSGGQGAANQGGQGGQASQCATGAVRFASRASFTTQSGEPEEVLSMVLPGEAAPHGWIVLLSARLSSEYGGGGSQDVRYYVDGVERGFGSSRSQNNSPKGGGPWQSFDWIPPASGDRSLSVEFRSKRTQYLATIDDLRVVAFAVPEGANLAFSDEPDIQTIVQPTSGVRVYQTVTSVEVPPGEPGDYLVMLGLVGNESPGVASIGVRAVAPGADIWPDKSDVEPRPYLCNPIDEWQSFMLARSVHSDGSALTVDLQVDASWDEQTVIDGSDIAHVRALAIRHDAFLSASTIETRDEQFITEESETKISELEVAGSDPCQSLVVAQFLTLHSTGFRNARFAGADVTFLHELFNSEQTKLSYATFAVLPSQPTTLANFAWTSDPAVPLSVRESVILALGVPGVP
jgi:hypothetical protein